MNYEDLKMYWLGNLIAVCKKKNIGNTELAALLDLEKTNVSRIMNGKRSFSEEFLFNACREIDVGINKVFRLPKYLIKNAQMGLLILISAGQTDIFI